MQFEKHHCIAHFSHHWPVQAEELGRPFPSLWQLLYAYYSLIWGERKEGENGRGLPKGRGNGRGVKGMWAPWLRLSDSISPSPHNDLCYWSFSIEAKLKKMRDLSRFHYYCHIVKSAEVAVRLHDSNFTYSENSIFSLLSVLLGTIIDKGISHYSICP